jgi:hypothetical protein
MFAKRHEQDRCRSVDQMALRKNPGECTLIRGKKKKTYREADQKCRKT